MCWPGRPSASSHEALISHRDHADAVVAAILAVLDAGGGERVDAAWVARAG
ncbi:MAG TPA: hypothetical protein VFR16_02465 [Agromyces mariniharenae]|nr:hypothetical protein [Agromyces mariniharenae]